jgi:hypothetical protein
MAVGRITGPWVFKILKDLFPLGVHRRDLLDRFARLLINERSARGAKGRIARRLYSKLDLLQRQGRIEMAQGVIRPVEGRPKPRASEEPMPMSASLRRRQFQVFLVEDRDPAAGNAQDLRMARCDFLVAALEDGWALGHACASIGIGAEDGSKLLDGRRR